MNANLAVLPLSGLAREVFDGLSAQPRRLPSKLFYDRAGSELFERITELPSYYLSSAEQAILAENADEIVRAAGEPPVIVELGAGTARKTIPLLEAASRRVPLLRFLPVDVSVSALTMAARRVRAELPEVRIEPMARDFTAPSPLLSHVSGFKLVLFIGSSIGNFEPMAAAALLANLRHSLAPGDALLLGTDMRKPVEVLLAAYDDRAGVTAAFNRNVLIRLNREFGANFPVERFLHRIRWNEAESRIEMHLESLDDCQVAIPSLNLSIALARGETIHTENSYKFTPAMIDALASNSGFRIERSWIGEHAWFTLTLMRA